MANPSTGDFSAADLLVLQARADQLFSGGPMDYEFVYPTPILQKFTTAQTARPNPRLTGSTCVGMQVDWLQMGDHAPTLDATSASGNCTLPTGFKADAVSQAYDNNIFLNYTTEVDLTDCNNRIEARERRAKQVMKLMYFVRKNLQAKVITFLDAQKQDNLDTMVGAGNVNGFRGAYAENADGKTIEVPTDEFQHPQSFSYLRSVAANNNMYNFYFLGGRDTFNHERYNSQFLALNDDGRNIAATFATEDLTVDDRTLDQQLGGSNLFAVDPAAYMMWNVSWSPNNTPVFVTENKFSYALQMNDILMMNADGVLAPVRLEVEMNIECTGRDALGRRIYKEVHEMKFVGGLAGAPAGVNAETGVLKFVKTTA